MKTLEAGDAEATIDEIAKLLVEQAEDELRNR
jgi:hypothetical protein